MAKRDEQEKDKGPDMPKLTHAHFVQIAELMKQYGGEEKLLAYWGAIKIDDAGNRSICNYAGQSEYATAKYEKFQPLKGIYYTGHGFHTDMPYTWCTEWLRQFHWWITENKQVPAVQALLSKPDTIKNFKPKQII